MKKGEWGENAAREYLEQKGYEIIRMNYRTRLGEIDIIASSLKYIVFAEVKTRKNDLFAAAREHVTLAKIERILKAAEDFLQTTKEKKQPRFDVIEVYGDEKSGIKDINHIEDAFGG